MGSDPPDSDSSAALEERRRDSICACYVAAHKALGLARTYSREPGTTGRRERECLEEVGRLRSAIAALRVAGRVRGAEGPSIRKADAYSPADSGSTSKRTA